MEYSSSTDNEVVFDESPYMKIYKNGRVERLKGEEVVPPSLDPTTNVESKDVVISEDEGITARLYIPKITYPPSKKLPIFFHSHGGAFVIESPFYPNNHRFVNTVVSRANVIGVSVHYRRATEHPVPIPHEDSWVGLKWVASHVGGNGPDEWLNNYANFDKVFLAGDSAGGNIAHYLGVRAGTTQELELEGVKIEGIALVHPYFWGEELIGSENKNRAERIKTLWRLTCPSTTGLDDPLINPGKDPNLGKLGCGRVLVFVAENDFLRERGWYYKESLENSGWSGVVEVVETKDEEHVFHLLKPSCDNTLALLNKLVSLIKQD